eukprot:7079418-Prymnesium_polylepis.1
MVVHDRAPLEPRRLARVPSGCIVRPTVARFPRAPAAQWRARRCSRSPSPTLVTSTHSPGSATL